MTEGPGTVDISKTTDPTVRVPNVLGFISNVLVLGVAVLILVSSSLEYDRVEEAFLFSASLADDPNPCAIPTPAR